MTWHLTWEKLYNKTSYSWSFSLIKLAICCFQECVQFVTCPELLITLLCAEALEDNEVVIVENVTHVSRVSNMRLKADLEPFSKPRAVRANQWHKCLAYPGAVSSIVNFNIRSYSSWTFAWWTRRTTLVFHWVSMRRIMFYANWTKRCWASDRSNNKDCITIFINRLPDVFHQSASHLVRRQRKMAIL